MYPDAVLEYVLGNRRIDVAVPSRNLAFEYQGERYHNDMAKEAKRRADVEGMGWRLIEIRKADLNTLRAQPWLIKVL